MSDKAAVIRTLLDHMKTNDEAYRTDAVKIWKLLSEDEKVQLGMVLHRRPPVHRNEEGRPIRDDLIAYGLITWATHLSIGSYSGEGYVVGTFSGYAVWRLGGPKATNVTLPGESKSS